MGLFSTKIVYKCTSCGYEEKVRYSHFSTNQMAKANAGQKVCPKCGKVMVPK